MKKIFLLIAVAILFSSPAWAAAPTTSNVTTSASAADGKIVGTVACDAATACTITWSLSNYFDQAQYALLSYTYTKGDATSVDMYWEWTRSDDGTGWSQYKIDDPSTKQPSGKILTMIAANDLGAKPVPIPRKIKKVRCKLVFTGGTPTDIVNVNMYLEN